MGFPACSGEVELFLPRPRALLRIGLLLGHLRRFISLAFRTVGLSDLLDEEDNWCDDHVVIYCARQRSDAGDALLVLRRDELAEAEGQVAAGGGYCTVCLCKIEGPEEIRWLPNCRHMFHRGCLDQWLELGQRTCPLCRAPLVAGEPPLCADDSPWLDSLLCGSAHFDFEFDWTPIASVDLAHSIHRVDFLIFNKGDRCRLADASIHAMKNDSNPPMQPTIEFTIIET